MVPPRMVEIDRAGEVEVPGLRQKIAVLAHHDEHVALEPHTDLEEDGHAPERHGACPQPLGPKALRRNAIAEEDDPPDWRVRAAYLRCDIRIDLERVRRIPGAVHLDRCRRRSTIHPVRRIIFPMLSRWLLVMTFSSL